MYIMRAKQPAWRSGAGMAPMSSSALIIASRVQRGEYARLRPGATQCLIKAVAGGAHNEMR